MLHFMQLAHPRHMDIYVQNSKHKSRNTEVTSFEHRTQNIYIQNTMSHIGFRIDLQTILRRHFFCCSSVLHVVMSVCIMSLAIRCTELQLPIMLPVL